MDGRNAVLSVYLSVITIFVKPRKRSRPILAYYELADASAQHSDHDFGVRGFSYRGFLGTSPHPDEDAPLRVFSRIAAVYADASASLDRCRVAN